MNALWLSIFWLMQIAASLLFKYGATAPERYWVGFAGGNIFGASSILLLMQLYKTMQVNVASSLAVGGASLPRPGSRRGGDLWAVQRCVGGGGVRDGEGPPLPESPAWARALPVCAHPVLHRTVQGRRPAGGRHRPIGGSDRQIGLGGIESHEIRNMCSKR